MELDSIFEKKETPFENWQKIGEHLLNGVQIRIIYPEKEDQILMEKILYPPSNVYYQ